MICAINFGSDTIWICHRFPDHTTSVSCYESETSSLHTKFSKYDSVVNNVVVSSLFNLEKMMVSVLQVRGLDRPVGRGERRVCWQPPPPPQQAHWSPFLVM